MLARVSSRELTEWEIFAEAEPFGEARADLREATVAAVIANTNRDPKTRPQPYTPADFLIDYEARWHERAAAARADEDEDADAEMRQADARRLLARMTQTRDALAAGTR